VTELGRQDGDTLMVDLRTRVLDTWDELWDSLAEPCGLPSWFGRNLNAWWDTIQAGAISAVLDEHAFLVVLLGPVQQPNAVSRGTPARPPVPAIWGTCSAPVVGRADFAVGRRESLQVAVVPLSFALSRRA